jgi:hypothetical protein
MDFLEVRLDPVAQNQPLTIRFQREAATAHFHVQVWKLAPGGSKPRAVTRQPGVMIQTADNEQIYTITKLDMETFDRLALIITRMDSDETIDTVGSYRVRLGCSSFGRWHGMDTLKVRSTTMDRCQQSIGGVHLADKTVGPGGECRLTRLGTSTKSDHRQIGEPATQFR